MKPFLGVRCVRVNHKFVRSALDHNSPPLPTNNVNNLSALSGARSYTHSGIMALRCDQNVNLTQQHPAHFFLGLQRGQSFSFTTLQKQYYPPGFHGWRSNHFDSWYSSQPLVITAQHCSYNHLTRFARAPRHVHQSNKHVHQHDTAHKAGSSMFEGFTSQYNISLFQAAKTGFSLENNRFGFHLSNSQTVHLLATAARGKALAVQFVVQTQANFSSIALRQRCCNVARLLCWKVTLPFPAPCPTPW